MPPEPEKDQNDDASTTRRIRRRANDADSSSRRRLTGRSGSELNRPTVPVLPTLIPTGGEIAYGADFSTVRFAQCWEDTDVLLAGLDIQPGDVCLSMDAAGENSLAMLTAHPAKIFVIDPSPAQLAMLELRIAAYRLLDYDDLLVFMGSRRGQHRLRLYQECRRLLSRQARSYWDDQQEDIARGLGSAGKFEQVLLRLRSCYVPLAHDRRVIDQLLQPRSREGRHKFFDEVWNTPLRRMLVRWFLPNLIDARVGLPISYLPTLNREVGKRIEERTRRLITDLDPSENPYLHWMLTGTHGSVLPFALRERNVQTIRANIDRLDWRLCTIEDALAQFGDRSIDRFNMRDQFEYLAESAYVTLLHRLARCGRRGGRLAYWNTRVRRRRPPIMADMLLPMTDLARSLKLRDQVFFYDDFVIEEVI